MSVDMILTGSRSLQLILFSQLTQPETWDSSSNPSILLLSLCPVIKFIILPYSKLLLRRPLPTEPHSREFLNSLLNYDIHTSLKPAWPQGGYDRSTCITTMFTHGCFYLQVKSDLQRMSRKTLEDLGSTTLLFPALCFQPQAQRVPCGCLHTPSHFTFPCTLF